MCEHDIIELTKLFFRARLVDWQSRCTVLTAAVALVCGSEWDDSIIEGLAETTALNHQIYVFEKDDGRSLPASEEHLNSKSARKINNPSST